MVLSDFKFNNCHDIYEARQRVYALQTWYSLSKEKKKEDYIWSEEMSIRQNKEYTAKYNAEIDRTIAGLKEDFHKSLDNLNNSVIDYIMSEFEYSDVKINRKQAELIWNFCRIEHEDDAQSWIGTMTEFVGKLLEAQDV